MRQLRRAEDLVQYPYTTCFIRFAYKKAMVNFGRKEDFEFSFSDGALVRSQWRGFWRHVTIGPEISSKRIFESLKAGRGSGCDPNSPFSTRNAKIALKWRT